MTEPSLNQPSQQLSDDARATTREGDPLADTKAPAGPDRAKWTKRKFEAKLVNPANRRKLTVIIVGTGLAGGAAAATPRRGRLQRRSPSATRTRPRRAHSIAAQGGINAAKNYQNDGDSRLPALLRHGQGRRLPLPRGERLPARRGQRATSSTSASRRASRSPASTAACSTTAPSAACRCSRTFYARGQTGQQLLHRRLPGAGAPDRGRHGRDVHPPRDARARRRRRPGARHRRPRPGHRRDRDAPRRRGRARHRRLRQRLLPLDQRDGLQRHRDLARAPQGRLLRQPLLHADPPDLHPGRRRPPVEADADVGVAAQRRPHLGAEERARTATRTRARSPRRTATTTSSGSTRRSATWCRATSPRRQAKNMCDEGRGVGPGGDFRRGVYLDFADAIERLGEDARREKYGNLFDMYERITGENPYAGPDAHLPGRALHDGRPVGRLRPAVERSPACSWPARRTSPTTARTGSARPR